MFLNLIVNAAHAINDVDGNTGAKGTILVTSSVVGPNVCITIRDTGSGIPEAVCPRIFDPFSTTKEVGRGTGQGLAIAQSIVVEKHRGTLSFQPELGVGTTSRACSPPARPTPPIIRTMPREAHPVGRQPDATNRCYPDRDAACTQISPVYF